MKLRRLSRLAAVMVLATMSLVAVNAAPAQASIVFGDRQPLESAGMDKDSGYTSHFCLDDSPAGVRMFTCNGLNFQQWDISYDNSIKDNPPVELRNVATGGCLDDSPQYHLRVTGCNGMSGGFQAWKTRYWQNETGAGFEYRNIATGLCLDAALGNVPQLSTRPCNGGWGGYQLFYKSY